MTSFVWQLLVLLLAMNSVSAKADQTHVYFMDVKRRNGVRVSVFWTDAEVKGEGSWGCFYCNKLADSFS